MRSTRRTSAQETRSPGCAGASLDEMAPGSAGLRQVWRRDPESNRAGRICNPLHNRFAIAPYAGLALWQEKRKLAASLFQSILFLWPSNLERERRLELPTSTLARLRSTN